LLVCAESPRAHAQEFFEVEDQWIDRAYFEGEHTQGGKPQRVKLWPDGVLPIRFKSDVEPGVRELVWQACREWGAAANVKCIEGRYQGAELVIGRSFLGIKQGCWSMLGSGFYFGPLRRRMNLGTRCDTYETVLHEMGHALGLTHEHQRADRDQYVEIRTQNVSDPFLGIGIKLNFAKQATDQLGPYDFFSIMHYGRKAASKNGEDTIVPRAGFDSMLDVIGRAKGLSELDRVSIASLYGAPTDLSHPF